jgi:phosphoribosylformylglycinamidine synthase subunit PurS
MAGPADLRLDTLRTMAAYAVHVEVSHRPGIADPAGATVERALPALGYANVTQVHIGKVIRLVVDAVDAEAARAQAEEMCEQLLANPVIESYDVSITALEPAP